MPPWGLGTPRRARLSIVPRTHAGQRTIRLLCGRAVLPGMQPAPRLGLCGSSAADRGNYLVCAEDTGRLADGVALFPGDGGRGESGDDRANRPGAWRAAVRDGAGVPLRDGGADLPGDGQLPDDERFRAVFLDGLRADCA